MQFFPLQKSRKVYKVACEKFSSANAVGAVRASGVSDQRYTRRGIALDEFQVKFVGNISAISKGELLRLVNCKCIGK